ncbi:MAG: hypothetical protein HKN11_10090 [Rhizobiales bacterium]|nr:hypothetical protein [Hyphomicrobiales bacterium]
MFARVTNYRMKPGSIDTAMAMLDDLKPQIMALPGLKQFINMMNDDGTGCVVSVVESEEQSNANQAAVQALWAQFADHLAEPPTMTGFNIIMNESNE